MPFKLWIAQTAAERLNQMQDPERSIEQAMLDYKRLGHSVISPDNAKSLGISGNMELPFNEEES